MKKEAPKERAISFSIMELDVIKVIEEGGRTVSINKRKDKEKQTCDKNRKSCFIETIFT